MKQQYDNPHKNNTDLAFYPDSFRGFTFNLPRAGVVKSMEAELKSHEKIIRIRNKKVKVEIKTNLTPELNEKLSALLGQELVILSTQINC